MLDPSFKFSEFKNITLLKTNESLSSLGFKMTKSNFSFSKRTASGKIVVGLDLLNNNPLNYEYHWVIIVWIEEIQEAMKSFFDAMGILDVPKWNTTFSEGHFIDSLNSLEAKFKRSFYNEILSQDQAIRILEKSLSTLTEKAIPLAASVSSLQGFQDYYLNKKQVIAENFANTDLFISTLLASYLKGKDYFVSLAKYLKEKLDEDKEKIGVPFERLYIYLDQINTYAKEN